MISGRPMVSPAWAERFFRLRERGTNVRTEVLGGATTFITMAYIIVVNPAILSFAGIPQGPSTVATILAAAFGSLAMGLYANRPIAVAPYMGENAFIAFGLAAMGIGWQLRLGAVFVSGLVFALITILRVRSWLANSISASLKHSFAVGIGLFLAFIGLYETGIVTSAAAGMAPEALLRGGASVLSAPDVPVKIGPLHSPQVLLAVFGFVLISVLLYLRVRGGILLGIAAPIALGYGLLQIDPRLRSPALIAERHRLPVLVSVPHLWSKGEILAAGRDLEWLGLAAVGTICVMICIAGLQVLGVF